MPSEIHRQLAMVRLQCRQPQVVREAEGEVLRAFKREVMEQRAMIVLALSEVTAFGPLEQYTLESMADGTTQREVAAGTVVAAQNALATEFYIVVSGEMRVSRKAIPTAGSTGGDHEVNRLLAGSHFGTGALLTGEQYLTTYQAVGAVTLAVMSGDDFHACTDRAIVNNSNANGGANLLAGGGDSASGNGKNRKRDSRFSITTGGQASQAERATNAVNRVPIFAPLSSEQKRLVSNALLVVHFRPGLYICEEGKPGSSFHIITSGRCRVTIHDPNATGQQREVTKLHQDDFFGEVALMESGLRTATVVAETDVTCLSLTRRHFDIYLKPIKAAIRESAAAKEILDMRDDDEDFDDDQNNGLDSNASGATPAERGGAGTAGGDGESGGTGKVVSRNFRNSGKNGRRHKRMNAFRTVATHALQVERRKRLQFASLTGNSTENLLGSSRKASRRHKSVAEKGRSVISGISGGMSPNNRILEEAEFADGEGPGWCKAATMVQSLARLMALSLENDTYAMLLDEMVERPTALPEFNNIVSEVLSADLRKWPVAYGLVRETARRALGKGSARLKNGELAVLSGILRINPLLRQRHCSDWPEYHVAELCRRMSLEDVRSMDKVFVSGAHGTKCYVVLRGLARVLIPKEDEGTGAITYVPDGNVGPGDVIGDGVLEGIPQRASTVVAVTDCEFAVLEESEFSKIKDRGHSQMSMDEKCARLKRAAPMRGISTYHLYKIALLVKTSEAAKDSVIISAGESSTALYFIVSGTVEVIQIRKRRVRNWKGSTNVNGGGGGGGSMSKGGSSGSKAGTANGGTGGTDGEERGDGEGADLVYKTARRVLTVLESGEYFGESGVLTYFKGGSKASAAPPPVTERFSIVARTNVELLVLRRKHFNIIEMPMLGVLKEIYDARLRWRARRKEEAHRGRAVLRAAKKLLDEASFRGMRDEEPAFPDHPRHLVETQPSAARPNGLNGRRPRTPPMSTRQAVSTNTRSMTALPMPLLPPGNVGWPRGGSEVMPLEGVDAREPRAGTGAGGDDGAGPADDVSLAGLSMASADSMEYSVDSGWLPNLRTSKSSPCGTGGENGAGNNPWPIPDDGAGDLHAQHGLSQDYRNQDQLRVADKFPNKRVDVAPSLSSNLAASISLPKFPPPGGGGAPSYGDRDGHGGGVGGRGRKGEARAGDGCGRQKTGYAGHKQPGLHGSKSFGAFWGETGAGGLSEHNSTFQASGVPPGRSPFKLNDPAIHPSAIDGEQIGRRKPQHQGRPLRAAKHHGKGNNPAFTGTPTAKGSSTEGGSNSLGVDSSAGLGSPFCREEWRQGLPQSLVVPAVSRVRPGSGVASLVPVRGISRVMAKAS